MFNNLIEWPDQPKSANIQKSKIRIWIVYDIWQICLSRKNIKIIVLFVFRRDNKLIIFKKIYYLEKSVWQLQTILLY